jgi:pimeloyl-ACP methyl ester carboxylesterase
MENWARQIADFVREVVQTDRVYLICNSIGGVVGLEAARAYPEMVKGIMLLNISLRMLHIKKQSWLEKPFIPLIQRALRETDLGKWFFGQVRPGCKAKSSVYSLTNLFSDPR